MILAPPSRVVPALAAVALAALGLAVASAPGAASAAGTSARTASTSAARSVGTVAPGLRFSDAVVSHTCDVDGKITATTVTADYDASTWPSPVAVTVRHDVLSTTGSTYETLGTQVATTTAGGSGTVTRTVTTPPTTASASVTDVFLVGTRVGPAEPVFLTISAPHVCGSTSEVAAPSVGVGAAACDGSFDLTVDATGSAFAWTPVARLGGSASQSTFPTVAAGTVGTVHLDLRNYQSQQVAIGLLTTSSATGFTQERVDAGSYVVRLPAAPACTATERGAVVPVAATRVVDTRTGTGAPRQALAAAGRLSVQVTGRGGIPAGAVAATVNVTTTAPQTAGYLQAWTSPTGPGTTSVLNFGPGQTISRSVVVPLDANGRFTLRNASGGTTQVVVDATGYALGTGTPGAGDLVPLDPTRLLDTRTSGASVPVGPGETYRVQVAGRAGISGAAAAAVQVTAVGGTSSGYLTVWSGEGTPPRTSNVNYARGQVVGGLSTVALAANGTVAVTNTSPGTVHLVVDVEGWWRAGTPTATTGTVVAIPPQRALDTRVIGGGVPSGSSRDVDVLSGIGPAGHLHGVAAVLVNVTAVGATAPGYLQAAPWGVSPGTASVVNFDRAAPASNLALVPVGDIGIVHVTNRAPGYVQFVVDVVGYVSR